MRMYFLAILNGTFGFSYSNDFLEKYLTIFLCTTLLLNYLLYH